MITAMIDIFDFYLYLCYTLACHRYHDGDISLYDGFAGLGATFPFAGLIGLTCEKYQLGANIGLIICAILVLVFSLIMKMRRGKFEKFTKYKILNDDFILALIYFLFLVILTVTPFLIFIL